MAGLPTISIHHSCVRFEVASCYVCMVSLCWETAATQFVKWLTNQKVLCANIFTGILYVAVQTRAFTWNIFCYPISILGCIVDLHSHSFFASCAYQLQCSICPEMTMSLHDRHVGKHDFHSACSNLFDIADAGWIFSSALRCTPKSYNYLSDPCPGLRSALL